MKKILSVIISMSLIFSCSFATVYADLDETDLIENTTISEDDIQVYSEKFPNAHLETKVTDLSKDGISISNEKLVTTSTDPRVRKIVGEINKNNIVLNETKSHLEAGRQMIASVSVTAYVNEKYKKVNGELECVESKLLSDNEVKALKNEYGVSPLALSLVGDDYDTNYSLTLNLNVYSGSGTERYVLAGTATWREGNTNAAGMPSKGEDYIGYSWGGRFDFTKYDCIVSPNNTAVKLEPRKVDYRANAGIVWGFPEYKYHLNYGNIYAKTVSTGLTLKKNTLTGKGNTTGVGLKYIHTYETTKGSIGLNIGTESVAGSFTLTGVDKQWPLVVNVNGLKY